MRNAKSLVISPNDLEAEAVVARAGALGFGVVPLDLAWGQRLDPLDDGLDPAALGRLVVLVECPHPAFEDELRAQGHIVEVIDHHLYIDGAGRRLDRRSAKSSLEQLVGLFGRGQPLTAEERRIAANDRGFWPALMELALAENAALPPGERRERPELVADVRQVREADLVLRPGLDAGTVPRLLDEAMDWVRRQLSHPAGQALVVLGCGRSNPADPELVLARAPDRFRAVLADALYLVHLEGRGATVPKGCWFGTGKMDRPLELALLFMGETWPTQLEYSGPGERVPLLDELVARLLDDGGSGGGGGAGGGFDGLGRLRIWAGGSAKACFFGADRGEAGTGDLGRLADLVVDLVLEGNRPLRAWRSSFLQVLRYGDDCRPDAKAARTCFHPDPAGEPERNYLVPYLAKLVTPDREQSEAALDGAGKVHPDSLTLTSFAYTGDARHGGRLPSLRVEWLDDASGERVIERPLAALKVHFLYDRLVVVEWLLQDGWPGYDDRKGLVAALLRRAGDLHAAFHTCITAFPPHPSDVDYPTLPGPTPHVPGVDCLADLLDLNSAVRQCYSSFHSDDERKNISLIRASGRPSPNSPLKYGKKTQQRARTPVHWFGDLVDLALGPFGIDLAKVELVLDERARVLATAALAGRRPELAATAMREDVLFHRLSTLERYGPRHFYDPVFLADEHARIGYRRFETSPTFAGSQALYGITDQGLVLMGYGWFSAVVSIRHVACHYRRLFLVGLLYAAVFHRFGDALADLARQRIEIERERRKLEAEIDGARTANGFAPCARDARIKVLRRLDEQSERVGRVKQRFIGFANALWFDEISTQIQGREMFRMITAELRVADQYAEITAEIERGDALEREDAAARAEQRRDELGVLAATLAPFTLLTGVGIWAWPVWLALLIVAAATVLVPVLTLSLLRLQKPVEALVDVVHLWWVFVTALVKGLLAALRLLVATPRHLRRGISSLWHNIPRWL